MLPEDDVRPRVAAIKDWDKKALNIDAGVSGAHKTKLTNAQKDRIRMILKIIAGEEFASQHLPGK